MDQGGRGVEGEGDEYKLTEIVICATYVVSCCICFRDLHLASLSSAEGVLRHPPGVLLQEVFVPSCV